MPNNDTVRLDGDPSGIIRALERATTAWNAYNRNLALNIDLSREIAKVSIDVTKAFREYSGFVKSTADQQGRLARNASKTNKALGAAARNTERVSSATKEYANTASSLNRQFDNIARSSKAAESNAQAFTISLRGMARLVGVQLIHRAISGLMRALAEGTREAISIQKALAEVRTISQENQLSLEGWFQGVKRLSNAYGVDLRQQIEGTYQVLSNQVAEGADTFRFLAESNQFAAVAVTSTAEAVQLLSGTLNSYGLSTSETNRVAAQFFRTIELGRVRGAQIANSFGNLTALSSELGIELAQLQAALAVITRRGVEPSKAMTQLRGILAKLLKPSEAMAGFFREIGVESGKAAIQTFDLAGTLERVSISTNGNVAELAKLISRLRGLSGAVILTGRGLEELKRDTDDIRNSTVNYNKAVEDTFKNSGKRAEIFTQTVKNTFKSAGNFILEAFADFAAANTNFFEKAEEERRKLLDRSRIEQETQGLVKAFDRAQSERVKLQEQETAALTAEINKRVDLTIQSYATIQSAAETTNKAIIRGIDDQVSATQKRYNDLTKSVADSARKVIDITREGEQTLFDWAQETRNTAQKISAITKRIGELQVKQSTAWIEGNKEAFDSYSKEIRKLFVDRRKLDSQLTTDNEKALKKRKDLTDKIAKTERDAAVKRANLERKLRGGKPSERDKIQAKIAELTQKTANKTSELRQKLAAVTSLDAERVNHAQEYTQEIQRQTTLYQGLAQRQEELAKKEAQRLLVQEAQRDQIKALFKEFRTFDFEKAAQETDPTQLRKTVAARQKLFDQLLTVGKKLGVDLSQFIDLDKAIGLETKTLTERASLLESQAAARQKLSKAVQEQSQALKDLAEARERTQNLEQQFKSVQSALAELSKEEDSVKNITNLLKSLTAKDIADPEVLRVIVERLNETRKGLKDLSAERDRVAGAGGVSFIPFETGEVARLISQFLIAARLRSKTSQTEEEINKKFERAKELAKQIKKEVQDRKTALKGQNNLIDLSTNSTEQLLQRNRDLLEVYRQQTLEIQKRTQDLGVPQTGAPAQPIQPQTQNSQPRIFNQLSALNSTPQSVLTAPSGGTTIGNINIEMNATGNLKYDVVTLGREVKRAVRRGLV